MSENQDNENSIQISIKAQEYSDVPNKVNKSNKIDLVLKPVGDAPIMSKKKWAVDRIKTVAWVVDFFKKLLKCTDQDSLFLYINQCFAPSLDETIGNLYECYGSDGKLVLHYCRSLAWG